MKFYISIFTYILCRFGFPSSFSFVDGNIHQGPEAGSKETHPHNRIIDMSKRLGRALSQLARDEIGVMALQAAFDNMEYRIAPKSSGNARLQSLVAKFSRRLMDYTNLVTSTRPVVMRLYETHRQSPVAPRFECCNLSERDLSLDPTYGCRVSRRKCCDLIPRSLPLTSFNPGHNLTERFQKQLDYWPHVKWFYFITADGLHSEFPAHNFFHSNFAGMSDSQLFTTTLNSASHRPQQQRQSPHFQTRFASTSGAHAHHGSEAWQQQSFPNIYNCHTLHYLRHRDIFVRSVVPAPIWLVIVVDEGQASQTQLLLGHRVAQLLIASLSEKDRVALLLASDSIQSAFSDHQRANSSSIDEDAGVNSIFQPAISSSKVVLNNLLADIHRPLHVNTNHTLALLSAFQVIRNALLNYRPSASFDGRFGPQGPHLLLAYISRGYLNELSETADILRTVADQQAQLPTGHSVVINAYMTVEEKSNMVPNERTFMNDLATGWNAYTRGENNSLSTVISYGHFIEINRTTDLSDTVGRFYELFSRPHTDSHVDSSHQLNSTIDVTSTYRFVDPPVQYSLPDHDLEGSGGLVMSISQAFYDKNQLIGVMGIDVHVSDLFDNFIHFTDGAEVGGAGSSTAFVVYAPDGYTLIHPTLSSDPRLSLPLASEWLKMTLSTNSRNGLTSASTRPRGSGSGSVQSAWYSIPDPSISVRHPNFPHMKPTTAGLFSNAKTLASGELRRSPALHLDISQFEVHPGFVEHVRTSLLTVTSGSVVLPVSLLTPQTAEIYGLTGMPDRCTLNGTQRHLLRVIYRWRRVHTPSTPFVVVHRSIETSCTKQSHLVPLVPEFEFHYHRLDLLKLSHTCLYLRQLATFDFGTIYLAPRAFSRPFARLRQTSTDSTETLSDVRHLMAYLLDHTMLISNPGLNELTRPSIRSSVAVVERIGKFWAHRFRVGKLRRSIIRRYVATDTGVMLIYPGTLLPETFDPTVRTWYRRALANPGHIVATGPYLDERGVGHIITLSQTIFEGNATGLHDPTRDKVSAVIAVDVNYRLIHHLLSTSLPECSGDQPAESKPTSEKIARLTPSNASHNHQQRCILMNDRGYLMEHPRWSATPEHNHLHYHEPIVAADLLKNHNFMQKKTCVNYPHRSLQRYYSLQATPGINNVIENVSPTVNQCVTYQLLPVQQTNLFIGLIFKHHRVGCTPRTAFCPCSTVGRRCLNCVRLEPIECECPCECPLPLGIGIPGWFDAVQRPPAQDGSTHPADYAPCPALVELEASHPIPLASLVASMASLTGQKNAPPACQLTFDFQEGTTTTTDDSGEPLSSVIDEDIRNLVPSRSGQPGSTTSGRGLVDVPRLPLLSVLMSGNQVPSDSSSQPSAHRCQGFTQSSCGHVAVCQWCLVHNQSQIYQCVPIYRCAGQGNGNAALLSPKDTTGLHSLSRWGSSSSFVWHSNVERTSEISPIQAYHQDEYTYRLVELSQRSRLVSSHNGDHALPSKTNWWFDAGNGVGDHSIAVAASEGFRVQIGPVTGSLLGLFTLLLLLLVYLAHGAYRRRRRRAAIVESDNTTHLQLTQAGGSSRSGEKMPGAGDEDDDDNNGRPPTYFPPSPPMNGQDASATHAATGDGMIVPLLVLLDSASTPHESATVAIPSTLAQSSDTDSSVVGRSFKSAISATFSSSSSNSSRASGSGVTGSVPAYPLQRNGRRRHRNGSSRKDRTNGRPEFDSLIEADGYTEKNEVVGNPTTHGMSSGHLYQFPVIVKEELLCSSEPDSAVGSDCLSSTSSSALSGTLLAIRLKTAARVRRLMMTYTTDSQHGQPDVVTHSPIDESPARNNSDM